jgi:hypothetical protein
MRATLLSSSSVSRILATPQLHPPNHYSCLLSIGTLWRYYCGRQAAAPSQRRCSSPLTSTYKTYAGTYGASVFYSAGCSFQSFAGCHEPKTLASAGCKRHMAIRPHAVSFSPFPREIATNPRVPPTRYSRSALFLPSSLFPRFEFVSSLNLSPLILNWITLPLAIPHR